MLTYDNFILHVCESHTFSACFAKQVFGLLSNGERWYFYKYDKQSSPPVQYYLVTLLLENKFGTGEVEKAVQPVLESLLGVYKMCLESSPLERPPKRPL